jgi:Tfp pilus assembly protein PilF
MVDALYLLALNYMALNDCPKAMDYLGKHLADKNHYPEKRIRLDPAFSKLDNNRDWIHLWQTEWYSDREKQLAECEYLMIKGQPDEASSLISQALETSPNDPAFLFLSAKIYSLRKEDRLSRQALDNAWKQASGNRVLMNLMLQFSLETGYYEKANVIAGELIRRDPSNPEYLVARALVRILDGKESLAMKEIQETEESGIAPAELYYQAGLKISASMPVQAEAYLTRAVESGKMDARFYFARGRVRDAQDKQELALGDLAMSLDINPNQPDLYMERARIRLDRGDTDGACYDWKKAMDFGVAKAADLLYKYCRLP